MPIVEHTTWTVCCDGPNCYAYATECESRLLAITAARDEDFVFFNDGVWNCSKCAKAKAAKGKAAISRALSTRTRRR